MPELERQLTAYAELLESSTPPLEDIVQRSRQIPAPAARRPLGSRAVVAAVAAAVVVLAAVGGALALRGGGGDVAEPTTTAPSATTTLPTESPLRLTPHPVGTIFFGGEAGGSDHPFTSPGAVIDRGAEIHMFRVEYGEEGAVVRHGVSTNGGVTFTEDPDPVLRLEAVACAPEEKRMDCRSDLQVRSGAVTTSGAWLLYLDGRFDGHSEGIAVATATDPSGPWTLQPDPVLTTGPDGAWDAGGVWSPSVVTVGDELVMYYVGMSPEGVHAIGMARSSDGVTWGRTGGPVLTASLDWEAGSLSRVDVTALGDLRVMLYAGESSGRRGLAVSESGTAWRRLASSPVLETTDVPRAQIRDVELVGTPGGILAYIETGGARTTSDIVVFEGVGGL